MPLALEGRGRPRLPPGPLADASAFYTVTLSSPPRQQEASGPLVSSPPPFCHLCVPVEETGSAGSGDPPQVTLPVGVRARV